MQALYGIIMDNRNENRLKKIKKVLVLIALLYISFDCFGQTNYEKGYFIDNQNSRTDCFIRNNDWLKNPTLFKYKLSENGIVQEENIGNIKEFDIPNSCKFIRAEVDIDMSPSLLKNLTKDKDPLWQHKQLFLKVLVEGKATLYYYYGSDIDERFFYSTKDTVITQLVFKEYIYNIDHTAFNDTFRSQLRNSVHCSIASDIALSGLAYQKDDLEKYFIDYNSCIDPTYKIPERKQNNDKINLALSTGLAYTSLSISNDKRSYVNTDFNGKLSNSFSLEIEYILPFNNSKWGVVMSPAYQSYHSKNLDENKSITIDFESIDFALGIKHYFFLNDNAKFFVDCYINSLMNYSINSKIGFKVNTTKDFAYLNMTEVYNTNFIFGAGFEYKRFFTELRYYTKQNILSRFGYWNADFEKISFNIGYKILKPKP
jgi:hypothetical protein